MEILEKKQKNKNHCLICNKEITSNAKYCFSCYSKNSRKVEWPGKEELSNLLLENSFLGVAKKFGVSDNALRKWCKKMELPSNVSELKKFREKYKDT